MAPTVDLLRRQRPLRLTPFVACFALLMMLLIAASLAAGGSFWSWIAAGAVAAGAGVALAIYVSRRSADRRLIA